ncbi:hypothetical protein CHGG_06840 [Chaetomium globosum CBS 148.51]|uniref:Uncharacterized protein n=1 Tax=Chaetomium globosum (strain ATCC 6205 / CBS 148.51 / DSM 1962 / NBRC 6347 / NRRL 1970) TaxID=306901 RepID=Q2GYW4_CHAGB|nr:uncharacterized protein CHGG_06840 [Chaetomium globosum CBS 148.51]EAQ85587.1 hypothetical protein CHGG_06840 [Chaetomium globosum CBS 148.51]
MANPISIDTLLEPPTSSVRPYPHHCTDLALQKYLLLHEQHESLRQHIDELRPTTTRQNSLYTPVSPSPASSPTRRSLSPDMPRRQPPQHSFSLPARKASYPSSHHDSEHHHRYHNLEDGSSPLAEVAVEEAKLCGVTEGMKRALTELLNCEAVRGDMAFRTWVQCRLMDTERELRSGRRRRSAPTYP